jgi:hypothetical protein
MKLKLKFPVIVPLCVQVGTDRSEKGAALDVLQTQADEQDRYALHSKLVHAHVLYLKSAVAVHHECRLVGFIYTYSKQVQEAH